MTIAEYRSAPGHNYSALKHILDTPAHYLANLGKKVEETPPMRLGTMLHSWWLEGKEDVLGDAVVKPAEVDGRTKEGKEWLANNGGKMVLSSEDWAQFLNRQAALHNSSVAIAVRSVMPEREKPMFGEIDGVPVKALFDALSSVAFLDLKTCQKNDRKSWGETVLERHYDFQYALYAEIFRQNYEREPEFYWVTVSNDANPACVVYNKEPFVVSGEAKLARAIQEVRDLERSGEQVLSAMLPYWYKP